MNKRGFLQDSVFLISALFVGAVGILVAFYLYGVLNEAFTSAPIDQEAVTSFSEGYDRFSSIWDYTFLFVCVTMVIGGMILSYLLPSNPVFLIIAVVVLGVLGGISGFIANAWLSLTENSVFSLALQSLPITNFIISHYIIFTIFAIILIVIAFYAKSPDGGL